AGGLACKLAHVPPGQVQLFAAARFRVWSGGCPRRLAVNDQVHARLVGKPAAADQKRDVFPVDLELRRGKRAGGLVASKKAINESFAKEPANRHLSGKRAAGRAGAEGCAGCFPSAVGITFKIGEDNVGIVGVRWSWPVSDGDKGQQDC